MRYVSVQMIVWIAGFIFLLDQERGGESRATAQMVYVQSSPEHLFSAAETKHPDMIAHHAGNPPVAPLGRSHFQVPLLLRPYAGGRG
jgi:hypothetical protein